MSKQHADMMRLLKQMENPYLRAIDLQLMRMEGLMNALGRPDKKLPPVVHVAGTNGKGSLIAYLRAMYEAAEKPVHVYTSPHLVRFNERVVVAGKEVDDAELYDALRRVHMLHQQFPSTMFEGVTAAAFMIFARHQADILLLEVGLGGRLDATNVIGQPFITAITPVSIDHSEYLGRDVLTIAREKAGIMKKQVPCVIGPQSDEVMQVLTACALPLDVPLMRYGHEWQVERRGDDVIYRSDSLTLPLPQPALAGEHQWLNAATAVAVMDMAQRQQATGISPEAMTAGIRQAQWVGRLQRLQAGKWEKMLPEGSEVWLDGGHNPAAGEALARWAKYHRGNMPSLHLVCGMLQGKDARGFLTPLAPLLKHLWAVPIHDEPNALIPSELAHKAQGMGVAATAVKNVDDALKNIKNSLANDEPAQILIAGSLYLVGQVIAEGV